MARYKVLHHPKRIDANNVFCCNAKNISDARAIAKQTIPDISIVSIKKIG